MKGAICKIAAVLSLATAIQAGGAVKAVGAVAKGVLGGRDVHEDNVAALFRRYPAPALTQQEIQKKLQNGEAFHPAIEAAMKSAGIKPPPGRSPPAPKKVARAPPAGGKALHPAQVAASIKSGQIPPSVLSMAKEAGYVVPSNLAKGGKPAGGAKGGKPAGGKRDLYELYAREAEAEAEADAEAEAEAEAYFEERDAYPEAYFEEDDLFARDAYPEAYFEERDAEPEAYFEERDAFFDEDVYA